MIAITLNGNVATFHIYRINNFQGKVNVRNPTKSDITKAKNFQGDRPMTIEQIPCQSGPPATRVPAPGFPPPPGNFLKVGKWGLFWLFHPSLVWLLYVRLVEERITFRLPHLPFRLRPGHLLYRQPVVLSRDISNFFHSVEKQIDSVPFRLRQVILRDSI